MCRLQRWFAHQGLDPRGHKSRVLTFPRSMSPDMEHWGKPLSLQDESRFRSQHCQTDLTEVRDDLGGPICIQGECPLQDVVLSLPARSSPVGDRCDGACSMVTDAFVCITTTAADSACSGEGLSGESVGHSGGTRDTLSQAHGLVQHPPYLWGQFLLWLVERLIL